MKLSLALFATILGSAVASSPARERIAQRHLAEAERRELMEGKLWIFPPASTKHQNPYAHLILLIFTSNSAERELMSMSMSMSMTDDSPGSAASISAGVAAGAAVMGAIALF